MPYPPTYIHLTPESTLPALNIGQPFRAVVIAEQAVSPDWQSQVGDWLVASGCLYMMAWGQDCSSWDDAVDWASLRAFDFGDVPDDRDVFTTWHTDEPLSEVFWFAKNSAAHPTVALEHDVLVHIAANASEQVLLNDYDKA
ncbi:DUF7684 family protein [Lysobacter sp. CA199]|uniref:DUF7684 family protein n=1 Tax=Lysobacter sp. CA199 TaxID=3455608 RepID=UPI003F8D8A5C